FYVWGHMKDIVYATEITTRDELVEKIESAAVILKNNFSNRITRTEIRKRARACIRHRGTHFETHLKMH
uniref:hypothetical protein n=1 Tax=Chryseobacterium sp. RR2-3-20 TaxID=2787626 RepID=UPI001ADED86B